MEMRFDPMTGEPLTGQPEAEKRFDPMTGKPIGEKKPHGGKGLKIAVAAVAAVVVIVLVVSMMPRIVYGSNYPVLQAFRNFCRGNHLMENMNFLDVIAGGEFTVTLEGEFEDIDVNMAYALDIPKKEASIEGSASYSGFEADFAAGINESEILLSIPEIFSDTFYYSYVEEKDGYIVDLLEDEGVDIDDVDYMLQQIFATDKTEQEKKMEKAVKEMLGLLEFEKDDKRDIEIDDKMRSCRGYKLSVDGRLLEDMLGILEDAMDKELGVTVGDDFFAVLYDELDAVYDEIECDVYVYVYKKQLAGIIIDSNALDNEIVVEFHGGNTRWENTTIEVEDMTAELTGSVKNNVERMELRWEYPYYDIDGVVFEYTYNFKNGDLELEAGDGAISLEGNVLKSSKQSYEFALERILAYRERVDVDLKGVVKKGADIAEISRENLFDIGNADEDDWMDIIEDVYDIYRPGNYSEFPAAEAPAEEFGGF